MAPPIPPEASKEIEFIKGLVARHFPVYDVRVTYDVVEFFCRVEPTLLEQNFEDLREEMGKNGYIPMITYDKGEHIITVAKKPTKKYRSSYVNIGLLVATFLTMVIAGALDWGGYADEPFTLNTVLMGMLTFTLPLMAILGIHELGHFFMARRRKVAASMPFFIPSIPPLGTFGAFISLRDPIPNKKSLMEIGVAGPIAGLLMAIPFGIIGLMLTNSEARVVPLNVGSEGVMGISFPLLYMWLEQLVPISGDYLMHPTAFAAWVGFLVTALNLLPVGQLDGGHVARALLGARAKYLSWVTVAVLVAIGFFYTGWLLFALLILFLGARHPPPLNDITPLDMKRKAVGVLAFLILVVAFVPIPMIAISADHSFEMVTEQDTNASIAAGGWSQFSLRIDNTGNTYNEIHLIRESSPIEWGALFKLHNQSDGYYSDPYILWLNSGETADIDLRIAASTSAAFAQTYNVTVKGVSMNSSVAHEVMFNLTVTSPPLTFTVLNDNLTIPRGTEGDIFIQVNNTATTDANLTFDASKELPTSVDVILYAASPNETGASRELNLTVMASGSNGFGVNISVRSLATPGEKTIPIDVYYSGSFFITIQVRIQVT
jgi:membrane-associated protease RseP (regulator of RpoE activity)